MKLIPLGPAIYQSYVTEEFFQFLTDEYNHIEKYERLFQNENQWNGKDYTFVNDENRKYVEDNLKHHVKEYVGTGIKIKDTLNTYTFDQFGYKGNSVYNPVNFEPLWKFLVGINIFFNENDMPKDDKSYYEGLFNDYFKMTYGSEMDFISFKVIKTFSNASGVCA